MLTQVSKTIANYLFSIYQKLGHSYIFNFEHFQKPVAITRNFQIKLVFGKKRQIFLKTYFQCLSPICFRCRTKLIFTS